MSRAPVEVCAHSVLVGYMVDHEHKGMAIIALRWKGLPVLHVFGSPVCTVF
jgi:hypothetical protein